MYSTVPYNGLGKHGVSKYFVGIDGGWEGSVGEWDLPSKLGFVGMLVLVGFCWVWSCWVDSYTVDIIL
jgi:hypothetical protein